MFYSYAMGVDKSIYTLEKQGFEIEETDGDYMVSFPKNKSKVWEEYIKTQLKLGFWNEYISKNENKVVFIFHLEQGFKRYVVENFNNDEVLDLCEGLCKCKFESIEKMISDNRFYKEKVFNN